MMSPRNIEPAVILQNNAPVEDFCGLSTTEMHRLLYHPFGERSPFALRPEISDEALNRIPFFRLTEEFLKILQREEHIALTGLGALPRKVLLELYGHRLLPEEYIEDGITKLRREHDSVVLFSLHFNTQLTNLAKKSRSRLTLTKEGVRLLHPDRRQELFSMVFRTFTLRFGWSSNDRYAAFPVGQFGWAYSVYLLKEFGGKDRTLQFYADKYLRAFPTMADHFPPHSYSTPLKDFGSCYSARVFDRFLVWFGFAEVEKSKGLIRDRTELVTRTDLLDRVLFLP